MYLTFNYSHIGYSHIEKGMHCQDYSARYIDNERIIITACDGHGGKPHFRSEYGSKFASEAVISVFKSIDKKYLRGKKVEDIYEKIKISILCEYNRLVERHIAHHPFKDKELALLNEDELLTVTANKMKAYGTTLTGAMLFDNKIFVISIGDSETLGIKKGNIVRLFDTSSDPAGNLTYSMCQEDAYQYLRVVILNKKMLDGVLLCTDGLSGPYQSYANLNSSFIRPNMRRALTNKSTYFLYEQIEKIATSLGIGDDVSLALFINANAKIKNYRTE